MSWDDALADLNEAVIDGQFGVGQSVIQNGVEVDALVVERKNMWLTASGAEVNELTYELITPIEPLVGEVVLHGSVTYNVVHPGGQLDRMLWRAPIRPVT